MVSSRRLAREWALKILYQIDVGKSSLAEAQESANDRLRKEFVQRGSRSASGSTAEEVCLEYITVHLRHTLPGLRLPFERTLTTGLGRIFQELPYWQEVRFERSFRTRAAGVPLEPPRLLAPLPDTTFFPERDNVSDPLAAQIAGLTSQERVWYRAFITEVREELPRLLDPELKKTGLAFARELSANRPLAASPPELQDWLFEQRSQFNAMIADRWRKVGSMVQKQTSDWLRTAGFTVKLVQGTYHEIAPLDSALGALASGWRLERQVAVDRNILRLAAFEMLHLPGVPTGASINEAVELAKKYSTAESGRFVNGVLGALAVQIGEKAPSSDEADSIETDEQDLDIPDIADIEESDTV